MSVAVISLAVFLTLQWKFWPYSGGLILTGGAFGAWVADLLMHQFNSFGSSIVSLLVFSLAVALSTPVSVARFGAVILSFLGSWGWKIGKLMGTYFLFLAGLLAMRAAHAAGDLLQKLMEAAIQRARTRGAAARKSMEERKKDIAQIEVKSEVVDGPVIGAISKLRSRTMKSRRDDEEEVAKPARAPKAGPKVMSVLEPSFEVPNALPELEEPVQLQIKGVLSKEPAILPHENSTSDLGSGSRAARPRCQTRSEPRSTKWAKGSRVPQAASGAGNGSFRRSSSCASLPRSRTTSIASACYRTRKS